MNATQTTETRFYTSNRYPGRCPGCRSDVEAGGGIAFKQPGRRWEACHKEPSCLGTVLNSDELGDLERIMKADGGPVRRELTADGRLYHPYPDPEKYPGAKALLSAFPTTGDRERPAWDRDLKCRWVSLELGDRERVLELADRLGLDVAPELRNYRHQIPEAVSRRIEAAESAGAYPYQLDGIRALALNERWLLGDDMGLGKTLSSLMAIPDGMGALVVVPKSLKRNWADECAKWRPDLTPVVCKMTRGRDFRWPMPGEVVITHYEALPAALTKSETEEAWWDGAANTIAIVDECHRAKNPKAQRSKKIQALSKHCARIWMLTGTPLLNKPFDLLGVLRAGGMDRKAFGGFRSFCRLFNASKNRWGGWEFGAIDPSVPERLRRVMLRRTKAEVLPDLPAKRRQVIVTDEISASTRKLLDDEWRKFLANRLDKKPEEITAEEFEKAAENDDDLPPFSSFSEIRAALAESRISTMMEYIEDCEEQDTPLLVFSAHRAPIDHLESRDGWATITGSTKAEERAEIVARFQAGELKGVGLTIAAGGVGLTLTRAATVLFVDLDWTPANNLQAEDRVARIGQVADSIQIIQLVTDHVLDRHVHRLLARKMEMIESAVERLVPYEEPQDEESTSVDFSAAKAVAAEMDRETRLAAVARRAELLDRRGATIGANGNGHGWREVELSEEQREALPRAWSMLLRMCDGAREDDGVGFNKADVGLAHVAQPVLDSELALQVAFVTLQKYSRQISEQFPCLYPWKEA